MKCVVCEFAFGKNYHDDGGGIYCPPTSTISASIGLISTFPSNVWCVCVCVCVCVILELPTFYISMIAQGYSFACSWTVKKQ